MKEKRKKKKEKKRCFFSDFRGYFTEISSDASLFACSFGHDLEKKLRTVLFLRNIDILPSMDTSNIIYLDHASSSPRKREVMDVREQFELSQYANV